MKRSPKMMNLLLSGFVFVETIDDVIDLQDESIHEGILIDYCPVLVVNSPEEKFKVYQLGGEV